MQQINPEKLTAILTKVMPNHYCHRLALYQAYVKQFESRLTESSFNRYLNLWEKTGLIFSAGRNWYSDLPKEFELYTEPVSGLTELLQEKIPLLQTRVWSTRQISSYYHHLPGKFFYFIYVDRYSMRELSESLRKTISDSIILLNPGKTELETFSPQNNNYIIRPLLEEDRKEESASDFTIEKLLADLAVEAEKISLMDEMEYRIIVENAASSGRISPSALFHRLRRRKVKNGYCRILKNFFPEDYLLSAPFQKKRR